MGPLLRRAALRSAREGPWGLLVAAAFTVACAAAAAAPVFTAAVADAALADQLAVVPPTAQAADAPVVRLVGGTGVPGQGRLRDALDDVPGLGRQTGTAASVGVETSGWDVRLTPFVSWHGHTERVRLFGDDDLPDALVSASGGPLPGAAAGDGPAVWLPQPVVERLGARAGDRVTIGVRRLDEATSTQVVLAGAYEVGPGGRLPADPPGTRRWTYRRAAVPVDSEFGVLPAFLAVTDVRTATVVAGRIGDDLLHSVEAQLDPPTPSLKQAERTVAGVRALQVEVRDPALAGERAGVLRQQVVSGLPQLVGSAEQVAAQTRTWTRPLLLAGVVLGLLAVAAVAVLGAMRRALELRTTVTWGIRPTAAAALATAEVVPAAVLGWLVGTTVAWVGVAQVGPSVSVGWPPVLEAAGRAALTAAAGCLVVAMVTAIAAGRAARLRAHDRSVRLPWEPALALVAVTAAAGLLARPQEVGRASALDVLVPALVVAATGALVGRGALALLARRRTSARQESPRAGPVLGLRHPAAALARARAAGSGRQAVLVITVLSAGTGLLGYSLAAAHSVDQVVQDRAAVLAGADTVAAVEASWLLDPGAAVMPEPDENGFVSADPVRGSRVPPLPDRTTIVWRSRATVPPDLGNVDVLAIDPRRFAQLAAWGVGPDLADARDDVTRLTTADAAAAERLRRGEHGVPVPAIAVGDIGLTARDLASVETTNATVPVSVLAHRAAFPGHDGSFPLVVVPADSFFLSLGGGDPRLRPPHASGRFNRAPTEFYPWLWERGAGGQIAAVTGASEVRVSETRTRAQGLQRPELVAARRSIAPQLALGVLVAVAAALVLVMYADRRARTGRAADVLLARMGLGRRGVVRSRAGELALVAALGLASGVVGGLALQPFGARLLDPGGGVAPAFALRTTWWALATLAIAAVGAWLAATAVVTLRVRRVDESGVLRDAD